MDYTNSKMPARLDVQRDLAFYARLNQLSYKRVLTLVSLCSTITKLSSAKLALSLTVIHSVHAINFVLWWRIFSTATCTKDFKNFLELCDLGSHPVHLPCCSCV